MKTRKFFNIAAILVLLSIICIFTACKEEEEIIEVKSGGTLVVQTNFLANYNYRYVYIYFDEIEVSREMLYENQYKTVTSTRDVIWKVIYGINSNGGQYNSKTQTGLLMRGEKVYCYIPSNL